MFTRLQVQTSTGTPDSQALPGIRVTPESPTPFQGTESPMTTLYSLKKREPRDRRASVEPQVRPAPQHHRLHPQNQPWCP